jgi:hypothetical protein
MAKYTGTVSGWNQISYLHANWPKIAMAGGAGYIRGYPGRGGVVTWSVNMPNTTSAVLRSIVDPILAGLRGRSSSKTTDTSIDDGEEPTGSYEPEVVGRYHDYDTFEAARRDIGMSEGAEAAGSEQAASQTFAGLGANKILTSWLWSAKDVSSPSLDKALRGAFGEGETQLYNDATMGVGTHNPPYIRGGGNAVNPAFRTAVMRPAAELQWDGTSMDKLMRRQQDALRFGASLKSLNPAGGTYANEADPASPDWQHAFWGSNYERLLAIKKKVDPSGIFYCRSCVGSEQFTDRNGVLCRR